MLSRFFPPLFENRWLDIALSEMELNSAEILPLVTSPIPRRHLQWKFQLLAQWGVDYGTARIGDLPVPRPNGQPQSPSPAPIPLSSPDLLHPLSPPRLPPDT